MSVKEKLNKLFNKNRFVNHIAYTNSTSKYFMNTACSVEFSEKTTAKKGEINSNLNKIIKKYIDEPNKLIQYMRLSGVKIYLIKNAKKVLTLLKLEEGFIIPQKGIKAFLLNIILSKKFKINFHTTEMIIFDINNIDIYILARALHKYYGFKNNLPGFDEKSQKIFTKLYYKNKKLDTTTLNDILSCHEALSRDLESINFTLQLSLEHERSKKVLNKILQKEHTQI